MSKIITITPYEFSEASSIAKEMQNNKCIIIVLNNLDSENQMRMLDYLDGVAFILNFSKAKISTNTYMYALNGVIENISSEF